LSGLINFVKFETVNAMGHEVRLMSEQEILKQCTEAFPGIEQGHHLYALEQLKFNSPEALAKQSTLARSLGFPDTAIIDSRASLVQECGQKLRKADWDRDMAAEIKSILSTVDDKINSANLKGHKEAQIMRVGAEQVTLPTLDQPAVARPPELNDRQHAVLDALNHKPGIEAELMKDTTHVYWIVARHKK
jgi:hypothetical protein